ncbi:hypothetical protein GCM10009628_26230 [Paeniglutamicibacter kerguelensis]
MFGGSNTARPAKRKLAAAIATLLSVGIVATGCTSAPAAAAGKNDSRATIVRIVDGDTIVAEVSGTETTIRLLNIDTPETKDPNEPVQCLGPESTEYMKSLLAPGDMIDLEYDVQRLDPYGRTLAGVYKDDSLVNADIVAAGLGVAVLYQPNERFYAEVKAAEQDAQNAEQGLFSPSIDCTVPAMVNQATSDLEGLEEVDPESSAAAWTALAVVAAAVLAGKAKKAALAALDTGEDGVAGAVWAARKAKHLPRLDAALNRATAMESKLATTRMAMQESEKKAKAAKKAKAEAKAEATRKATAEREAKADRRAAAAAKKAAQRKAALKKRYVAPKKTYRAPVQTRKPKRSGGSYAGYTGPRCYAPGGKSWKPCG